MYLDRESYILEVNKKLRTKSQNLTACMRCWRTPRIASGDLKYMQVLLGLDKQQIILEIINHVEPYAWGQVGAFNYQIESGLLCDFIQ